ncbi:hypothetical protein L7F22_051006 [Adiantum nelumboides]|nr:hypothetical protein [Adiantum nelumboides]
MSASTSTVVGATPLCIHPPAFTKDKLEGTNYTLWKLKFFAILASYKLLDIVLGPNGINLEPIATIDFTNPSAIIPLDATLLWAWRRRNANALCAIVMCVSDSILTLVQHTTKAHEAWNILACQYEAHMLRYQAPCLPDGRYISPTTGIFTSDTTAGLHRHGLPTESDGTLHATHLLTATDYDHLYIVTFMFHSSYAL